MATDIKTKLEQRIDAWGRIGHPAIMERFVLRNGKLFTPKPFVGERMTTNECFRNASAFVDRDLDNKTYVEGYGIRERLGIPIHHAWVGVGDKAIDPTWERPDECQYLGVEFDNETRWEEQLRTGYYGLLDTPATMINIELIFRRDPELKAIIEQFIGREINVKEEAAC